MVDRYLSMHKEVSSRVKSEEGRHDVVVRKLQSTSAYYADLDIHVYREWYVLQTTMFMSSSFSGRSSIAARIGWMRSKAKVEIPRSTW